MLTGRYQSEGTGLRLDVQSTGSTVGEGGLDLFATVTGTLDGQNVREQAVSPPRERRGRHPGDDRSGARSDREPARPRRHPDLAARAQACTVYMQPVRQGYEGATQGMGTCVRAIQGAVGEWGIQVRDGSIRLRNRQQTLVFRETGDRAGR